MYLHTQTLPYSERKPIVIWLLSGVLSAAFLAAGVSKLLALPMHVAGFTKWGYPLWFMFAVGAAEVSAAIGLWVPRVQKWSALVLLGLMLGALLTHVVNNELSHVGPPAFLLLLAATVTYLRRREWRQLLQLDWPDKQK